MTPNSVNTHLNWPFISYGSGIIKKIVANKYSSISCIKDKSIATYADVTRLLLMFENLRLTLAKKRCEWECNKTIFLKTFMFFHLLRHLATTLKCLFSN